MVSLICFSLKKEKMPSIRRLLFLFIISFQYDLAPSLSATHRSKKWCYKQ